MRVSRVRIVNYRNLKSIDVPFDNLVALVGENNSGKSNFLKALSLPFTNDESGVSKSLSWFDINDEAKEGYYSFIQEHRQDILEEHVDPESFRSIIPSVSVTIDFQPEPIDAYDVKDILVPEGDNVVPRIQYKWSVSDPQDLLSLVSSLLRDEEDISDIKMSLLPMNEFRYEVVTPSSEGNKRLPYDVSTRFKCFELSANRDDFAANPKRIGSKPLIHLLQGKVDSEGQKRIEKGYGGFLETIREAAKLDEVINWQDYSDDPHARDFFDSISVLPNMPAMSSILSGIRLGYDDESLSLQGLGHRNLVLMAVMLNAYLEASHDISLRVVEVEEPEAHLCANNVLLMASFFKAFGDKDSRTQLVYTTHDAEFVNKVGLDKVIVLHGGAAVSLKEELGPEEMDYLSNNPNTDIFKLLFSHRLVLVEGITEELLIKSFLQAKRGLNDIKVLSFHKGYRDIIDIWKKINLGNANKLAVIRDFDDQPNAKREHEKKADSQVYVSTTTGYTLETDFVNSGDNYQMLIKHYGEEFGWVGMDENQLQEDWRKNKKTGVMFRVCHDLVDGKLPEFTMPSHIMAALDFLNEPIEKKQAGPEALV